MPTSAPLILLSGMGADERVFAPQAIAFPNLIVPKWLPPEPDESLPAYVRRFAAAVNPNRPCFIGGASFGGFVALEMAAHLPARACFLIGSVRSPAELPLRVRALRGATAVAPAAVYSLLLLLGKASLTLSGSALRPTTRQLLAQAATADAAFLRWAARAVLTWQPSPPAPGVPIFHIHGDRDRVLPANCTHPDRLVPGAGHVLSLTHPEAVNAFLAEHMQA